jgi:hypothetical protein
MKKLLTLTVVLFICAAVLGQNPVPNIMNYQAVARNTSGQALANQNIRIKLTITQGGNMLYTETRNVLTNALGLFNVQIGSSGASNVVGDLTSIDWLNSDPPIYLKVELDVNNSGIFSDMGSQQLVTVPYSFASQNAQNASQIGGRNVSTATPAVGDVLKWENGAWLPAAKVDNAINAEKIGGNAVSGATPALGDILKWNGTEWVPATINTGNTIQAYSLRGTANTGFNPAYWSFIGNKYQTVTVTDGQYITGNAVTTLGSWNGPLDDVGISFCYYKEGGGGNIMPFYSSSILKYTIYFDWNAYNAAGTLKVSSTETGEGIIPPGTYRIGMGVLNPYLVDIDKSGYINGSITVY